MYFKEQPVFGGVFVFPLDWAWRFSSFIVKSSVFQLAFIDYLLYAKFGEAQTVGAQPT